LKKLFSSRFQPTFEKTIQKAQDGYIISSEDYLVATYFCICHLYVGNPQGRIGAINEMKLQDVDRLKTEGIVGSSQFKTRDTYGVQFIAACKSTIQ
jgi:hypothetical protein